VLVATLSGGALYLLHSHAESRRAQLAAGYGLVLLGVFWTRSLGNRLRDAGWPEWSFWPYFLVVFTGCLAALALKFTSGRETLALFLLLQLPAALLESRPGPADALPGASGLSPLQKKKAARPVAPIGRFEFAVYLLLIVNLWEILHLLRGDVNGLATARSLQLALDAGSGLLCVLWFFSVRGRLKALGRMRWTMHFCALTLLSCILLFYLREIGFLQALILFSILQIPAIFLRRESISARFFPVDQDS
jgi:hypothetical protein